MARPVWSGAISFGMVSIPVRLVSAVRRRTVSFNQLDADTMSRIRYRKVSDATGEEVPPDRIVRAANVGGGNYVVIDDDELAALAPQRSREIVIESFVPAADIDPIVYDSSFHVTPDSTVKPYALLAEALEGTDRVAIGRFVMRQKEHLAGIRSVDRRLTLSTMVFADEVVDPAEVEEFESLEQVEVDPRELDMARSLLEAMSDEFHLDRYVDEYRVAVDRLIAQKAQGQVPVAPTAPAQSAKVIDLAEALQASLEEAQASKRRHPASKPAAESTAAKKPGARKKAPAKKAAARKRSSA